MHSWHYEVCISTSYMCTFSQNWGFPGGSDSKESACKAGDLGSGPGLGRSPGEGKGYSLQYSDLENSMDCIVHGVTKSQTRLSDFPFKGLLCTPPIFLFLWLALGYWGSRQSWKPCIKVDSGACVIWVPECFMHGAKLYYLEEVSVYICWMSTVEVGESWDLKD